jgi:hypothetical protein
LALDSTQYSLTLLDYSGEKSVVSWNGPLVTGAAFDIDAWLASMEDVADAIMNLTDCTRGKEQYHGVFNAGSDTLPAVATAQREVAIRIFYADDTTGKKYSLSIPGPEVAEYPAAGGDDIDITAGDMAAFVTAFENYAESEQGNSVTVYAAKLVGRRN